MTRTQILLVLFAAALLEAGGDALVRRGIHASHAGQRALLMAAGAAALFAYSWAVNSPPWDFGEVLGLYMVLFFLTAQAIAWAVFGQTPSTSLWIGGALIGAGGLVIALGKG